MASSFELPSGLPTCLGEGDDGFRRLCELVGLEARAAKNGFVATPFVKAELKRSGFSSPTGGRSAERLRRKIVEFYSSPSIRTSTWREELRHPEFRNSLEALALREYMPAIFDEPIDKDALQACTQFFDPATEGDTWRKPALAALPSVRRDLEVWSDASDDRRQVIALAAFAVATVLDDVRLLRWAAEASEELAEQFKFATSDMVSRSDPGSDDPGTPEHRETAGKRPDDPRSVLRDACDALIAATNRLKTATPSAPLFDSVSERAAGIERLRNVVLAAEDSVRRTSLIDEALQIIESQAVLMEQLGDQRADVRAFWERAYKSGQTTIEALEAHVDHVRTEVPIVSERLAQAETEIEKAERAVATSGQRKSDAYRLVADAHARLEDLCDDARKIVLPESDETSPSDDSDCVSEGPSANDDDPRQTSDPAGIPTSATTTNVQIEALPTNGGSESATAATTSVAASASHVPAENYTDTEDGSEATEPPKEDAPAGSLEVAPRQALPTNTDSTMTNPQGTTTTNKGADTPPGPINLRSKAQPMYEAAWSALGDGHLGIAYHITRLLPNSTGEVLLPPPSLIAASALSSRITQPDEKVIEHYQTELSAADELLSLNGVSQPAIQLLILDATLRAALFAPTTTALNMLRRVQLPTSFSLIANFASRWAQQCERLQSTSMDIRRICVIFQKADREAEIQKLEAKIKNWLQDTSSHQPSFVPAARVWKHWAHHGLIREVERIFSGNPATRCDDVTSIFKRYDDSRSFSDLVRDTNNRFGKRSSDNQHGRTVEYMRRDLFPLMENLRSWVRLVDTDQLETTGFVGQTLRELRSDLVTGICTIQSEVEPSSAQANSLPVMAALKHLLFTTKALLAVFDGAENENAIVTDETSVHAMLARDLLLFPSLRLDLKHRIVHNNMDEVLAILTQPKPTKYGLQEAFDARLAADDLEGAYLINEWLLEIGDASASECNEKLERALDMRWENSEANRKHLVEEVEHAYFRDQIDSETRELLAALVTGTVRKDLPQILDVRKRCKEVESELIENRERGVRRIKQQFQNLEQDLGTTERETFDAALEDGDLVAARELLGRLQKGEGIGGPEQDGNRLHGFLNSMGEIEVSMSGAERPTLEGIDSTAKKREAIAGLDFRSVPESEMLVPSRLLEPWRRLTRRGSACRGDLKELLEAIGFDDVRVELDGHTGAAMVCNPLADRQLCPLHVYGSEARDRARDPRGHYQILLSWPQLGRPSRDALIQLIDAAGTHAIVLHFGPLRDDRDELRQWSIYNHRRFIVLDETLLYFLSTVGNGRLRTFFECTLPFACVDPYVTTASIVPPEMFYGRAREKMEIMDPFGSCFVYGGRQLGKTALLRSAEADFNRSSSRQLAKWIDLKHNEIGLARDAADIWPVLWRALQEIDVISSERQTPRGEDGLRDALSVAIQEWIGESGRLLLLLDEADAFLTRDARTDFVESTRLKGIMENTERRFKVVFSGLHNVLRTTERANHPLAHLGQAICVGPLLFNGEWREAQNLVREPLLTIGCCFKDQRAVLHVLAQTNYYPSLIQLFGAELVRYVRDLRSFPYHLGVDDIASVFKRPAVRDAIRERFLLTLQLDDRYEVVAFAMALEFAGDHGALAKGMPRDRILELAQEHWEDGFPTPTKDVIGGSEDRMNFDVLLQEMEGLGVLRRVHHDGPSGHFYTLRNPNILALLGTKVEIDQTLDKDRRLPELFEPDSFRDRYDSANGVPRRGMLTNEQEARLRDSAVSVIVGNAAARIDELRDFLARPTKASLRVLGDCLDANHFRRELTKSRPDRRERRVFLVPAESPWSATWLRAAFEALRRMQRGRFVRVVFVADPAMLWMTLKDSEDGTSLGGERVEWLSAGPWDLTFLRHWCDVQDLTVNRKQIDDLLEISGGWPMVLERYEKSPSKKWDKRIQDLSQLVKDESDDFRRRLGIDAEAEKQLSELLKYEGLSGHAMEELGEYDAATLVTLKRRLSWAIHLRLASSHEGAIEFNPLVKRVVRPGASR